MKRTSFLLTAIGALALAGCDDGTTTTGTGGATTSSASQTSTASGSTTATTTTGSTSATSTSSGMGNDLSECTSNADCPGGACVDVNNGFKMCQLPVVEATACQNPGMDACCNTTECKQGEICVPNPITPHCAGIPQPEFNVCAKDECASNADCQGGVCMPAGTIGNKVKVCMQAQCFGTICGQESITPCAMVREPCCNTAVGFYCIDECRKNEDCPGGYCDVNQQTLSPDCEMGGPTCPL